MRRESQRGRNPKEDDGRGKGRPAASFTVGAIALVFLATGYQTALFIHRASIAKITADRDAPDTVYVYESRNSPEAGARERKNPEPVSISRKSAPHSPAAMKVREKYGTRLYESFRFDPNTADMEELMRLGFSRKQAQSIDSYRKAGGRFRRKEDFAKSFVVADSVYARLEPFIDIPRTNINMADSAAFDALPGIGPYYAAKIIEYRMRLGGFTRAEQLLEIKGIDREKYGKFEDLIYVGETPPFRLWTLPEDSLALHPYIGRHAAGSIILFRDNNPVSEWSVKNLVSAGIFSDEDAERLRLCRIEPPPESP